MTGVCGGGRITGLGGGSPRDDLCVWRGVTRVCGEGGGGGHDRVCGGEMTDVFGGGAGAVAPTGTYSSLSFQCRWW